jgi:F-type H+-transporting ATPase subunit delta
MKDKIIAKIYAKTFTELAKENNVDIAKELTSLQEVINSSNDLENVLFLEVFAEEEKSDIFKVIAQKINLSVILTAAIQYLISEKRISLLPLIYKEVMVADDYEKGFMRGTIEGNSETIDEVYKEKLINHLKNSLGGKTPVLDYRKNEDITAGYKVTVGDFQLDATVDNQLQSFRDSVLGK